MNDERPIEKLLRRYAKKRRDDSGAPLELHPATRRMLQGEVARQYPKRASAGDAEPTMFAQILIGWRARLIWMLPVLLVLGIGVWVLIGPGKPGHEFDVAQNAVAPAAPTEVVRDSFKALETPEAASPAPAVRLATQPALDYTDPPAAHAGRESSGAPLAGVGDSFAVPADRESLLRKQGEATTVNTMTATSQSEPALKVGTDHLAANELAQLAPQDQLRSQTVVAKREVIKEQRTLADDKVQAKSVMPSASARADSDSNLESVPKVYAFTGESEFANAPAGAPAAFALDPAARYYRQDALAGAGRERTLVYSQAFANQAPAFSYAGTTDKSGPVTPVLSNFQVEQSGNQLRVIDGDGSTYLGEMELPAAGQTVTVAVEKKVAERPNSKSSDKLVARRIEAVLPAEKQSAQSFAYNVSGTNRTLNQQVVFSWNFVALTNGLAAAQVKLPSRAGNLLQYNLPAQQLPLLLNNSAINGRVRLGNAKEIEVNAVPVSP